MDDIVPASVLLCSVFTADGPLVSSWEGIVVHVVCRMLASVWGLFRVYGA